MLALPQAPAWNDPATARNNDGGEDVKYGETRSITCIFLVDLGNVER
jgi:hypothetical protein